MIYYTKFLKNTICRHLKNNIEDIIFDAFLSIIKRKFKTKDSKVSSRLYKLIDNLIL